MYYYSNLSGVGFSFGSLVSSIGKGVSTLIRGGSVSAGPVVVQPQPALPPTTPTTRYDEPAPGLIPGVSNTALLIGGGLLAALLLRGGRRRG